MQKNSKSPAETLVPPSVPMYYVDQPAALMLGPHVSRLTFGIEDQGEYPTPVVTIAIPTVSLLMLVKDLSKTFESDEFKADIAKGLTRAAKTLDAGLSAEANGMFVPHEPAKKKLPAPRKGK